MLAAAERYEPHVTSREYVGQSLVQQVETFLPSQARDHSDQGRARRRRHAQQVEQRFLVELLAREVACVEAVRDVTVGGRVPLVVIHAIQDADYRVPARAQVSVESVPAVGRADLERIRRAHRRDRVRMDDAVTHRVDASGGEIRLVEHPDADPGREVARLARREHALVTNVVNGEHALRRAENALVPGIRGAQQQWCEGSVPVVRMHDLRRETHALAALECGSSQGEVAQCSSGASE
jgi:hypothetical protein